MSLPYVVDKLVPQLADAFAWPRDHRSSWSSSLGKLVGFDKLDQRRGQSASVFSSSRSHTSLAVG